MDRLFDPDRARVEAASRVPPCPRAFLVSDRLEAQDWDPMMPSLRQDSRSCPRESRDEAAMVAREVSGASAADAASIQHGIFKRRPVGSTTTTAPSPRRGAHTTSSRHPHNG